MKYLLVLVILFVLELSYFKIADYFNITDKPNQRSSHSVVTLRGGGVIFYFGALFYFFNSGFAFPWFFCGLTMMVLVSFLDDLFTLSNKVRLLVHFLSVYLMAFELGISEQSWYILFVSFIVIVGVINAYNFMDGINGITASYSISVIALLLIVNSSVPFIPSDLLIYTLISLVVFAVFNFRIIAKCFAGDVGSVAIAFIILFCLGALIIKTEKLIYILFLTVYGIDTIWTIVRRLILSENIFEAHRSHLYQYLANEAKINKLFVALWYGIAQFIIGLGVIYFSQFNNEIQILFTISILVLLSLVYLLMKRYIIQRYNILN